MKVYRIECTAGLIEIIVFWVGCLTIVALPLALVMLPSMFQIVVDDEAQCQEGADKSEIRVPPANPVP